MAIKNGDQWGGLTALSQPSEDVTSAISSWWTHIDITCIQHSSKSGALLIFIYERVVTPGSFTESPPHTNDYNRWSVLIQLVLISDSLKWHFWSDIDEAFPSASTILRFSAATYRCVLLTQTLSLDPTSSFIVGRPEVKYALGLSCCTPQQEWEAYNKSVGRSGRVTNAAHKKVEVGREIDCIMLDPCSRGCFVPYCNHNLCTRREWYQAPIWPLYNLVKRKVVGLNGAFRHAISLWWWKCTRRWESKWFVQQPAPQ